jgi:hypothetical protein
LAARAGESPARHAGLSPPVTDVRIPRLVYLSRMGLDIVDSERATESQMVKRSNGLLYIWPLYMT